MNMKRTDFVSFADGSQVINSETTSQIGFLIFLTDGQEWHLLNYKSSKSRRVVRSPLAAEVHALAEAADASIMTQHDLRMMTVMKFKIRLLTDSKSLFEVIAKESSMTEKGS